MKWFALEVEDGHGVSYWVTPDSEMTLVKELTEELLMSRDQLVIAMIRLTAPESRWQYWRVIEVRKEGRSINGKVDQG